MVLPLPIALLIVASVKSAQFPLFILVAKSHGRPTRRVPFLWFSLCIWGFPYDPYLSSLGRKHDIQNLYGIDGHCYHYCHYRYRQGTVFGQNTDCLFIHCSDRIDVCVGSTGLALVLQHFILWPTLSWELTSFLVSPSILSYLIHDQFFNFIQPQQNFTKGFWETQNEFMPYWA